jgi:cardiolipin synthase
MLSDGPTLEAARLELIRNAGQSIYLTTFHISDDAASTRIYDALCARARDGLEVRFIIERFGSPGLEGPLARLRACGAHVIYHRTRGMKTPYVLHEKLLIADGRRMIVGGSGYQNWYATGGRHGHYDMDFVVEGEGACRFHLEYQRRFAARIRYDRLKPAPRDGYGMARLAPCGAAPAVAGGSAARAVYVWGNPQFSEDRPILRAQVRSIVDAKNSGEPRIRMYAPYFVPHPKLAATLVWALRHGARVDVITNARHEGNSRTNIAITLAMGRATRELRAAGGRVHLWKGPGTMHRKGGTFGPEIAVFGSDNFDNRGQDLSSETSVFTNDAAIHAGIGREFDEDLAAHTWLLDEAYLARVEAGSSWIDRLIARYFWQQL